MSRRTWVAGVAVLPIVLLTGCDQPQPWRSELVSLNADGTGPGNDYSHNPVLSPDGTMIAFQSQADDLGPAEGNDDLDVFLRDLATGTTTLVSVNAAGTQSGNQGSVDPVFSPDGRKIAFVSFASDLAPSSDGNEATDIYVRDLDTGMTTLVSATAAGAAGNGPSTVPAFSPDGTHIVFESEASDLAGPDTNLVDDVYARDLTAGTTTLVSRNAAGTDAGTGASRDPGFTPDGRVLFESQAGDLGPADGNGGLRDVYLHDLAAGTTSLVSVNAAGTDSGNSDSFSAVVSPDGTKVAFESVASDLGPVDTNTRPDLYLRDLITNTTSLVSVNGAGTDAGDGRSVWAVFSPDGTKIAFLSEADDLGSPDDPDGWFSMDVYLRDLTTGTTSLITVDITGTAGNTLATYPTFSPDGRRIAFISAANNLVPKDTPRTPTHPSSPYDSNDLFVRDLDQGKTTLVSANAAGTDSANAVTASPASFGPSGDRIYFSTAANDLGPTDDNNHSDIYVATLDGVDLTATVEGSPDPVPTGGQLTYELVVTNFGPDTAEATEGAVFLPEGVTFISATTSAGSCAPPPATGEPIVACALGNLADGDSVTITVQATVTAPASTVLTVIAGASSPAPELDSSDNYRSAETNVG